MMNSHFPKTSLYLTVFLGTGRKKKRKIISLFANVGLYRDGVEGVGVFFRLGGWLKKIIR